MNNRNTPWFMHALAFAAFLTFVGPANAQVCDDGTCDAGEDPCTCPDDCPNDPDACEPCECGMFDFQNCACDPECEEFEDCCDNACDACGCGVGGEAVCGNGIVEVPGEQCDGGVCCTESCTFASGTTCGPTGPCTANVCQMGLCITMPINEGGACGPSEPCFAHVCQTGLCSAVPTNEGEICGPPAGAPPCNQAVCQTGSCITVPINDGGACGPSGPCYANVCQTGLCSTVPTNQGGLCSGPQGPCITSRCSGTNCATTPINEGGACGPSGACFAALCQGGACVTGPTNEGQPCGAPSSCTQPVCTGSVCTPQPIICDDYDPCTEDSCNLETSTCEFTNKCGACCLGARNDHQVANADNCIGVLEIECRGIGGAYQGDGTSCDVSCQERVSNVHKGSLLFYSKVELRWNAAGVLVQDTVLSLLNDYPADVNVQMYFINGDAELDPVFTSGPIPILIAEGEPGWNWVDCALLLTPDQPLYWSAATGNPIGCQPFAILDPDLGNGQGRPDPEGSTDRVLRGYVIAYAVDAEGQEVCWNHLSGKATIVNYADSSAWEYNAWAFQSRVCTEPPGKLHPDPGILRMDGLEYDRAFDALLFDFFASGSQAFSRGGTTVTLDTDLTLHLLDGDFRENSYFPYNPPTTKAHFDIWNMNERKLSNTRRCITCWDQTLISNYGAPNNMLLMNLQSDKGKARIDGKQANECEESCLRTVTGDLMTLEDIIELLGDLFGEVDIRCSIDASLLGVAAKHLTFSGGAREVAGDNLVGMGVQAATIRYDLIDPPGTLREDAFQRIGRAPPREHDRLDPARAKPRG